MNDCFASRRIVAWTGVFRIKRGKRQDGVEMFLGEERECSSGRLLVKLNRESRRRGKCMHDTVLSLCDMKKVDLGICTGGKVRCSARFKVRFLINQDFHLPFYHFMACSTAQ